MPVSPASMTVISMCVLRRHLGSKAARMVYGRRRGGAATQNEPTTPGERARFCIADDEVIRLAE